MHLQVIDTQRYTVRLYTSGGGVKLIRRHNGAIERQYRLNIGKLPIAYRYLCEAMRKRRRSRSAAVHRMFSALLPATLFIRSVRCTHTHQRGI